MGVTDMHKPLLVFIGCGMLISSCALNSEREHAHTHKADVSRPLNNKILNCVVKSGHHVYEEKMNCPIGGKSFVSLKLGTHSTYGVHLDWEPISYMRFPVPLPVCPDNGFVVVESEYSDEKLKQLKRIVESEQYQQLYEQKHATYFLYAKMLEFSRDKSTDHWWLYLNATWEAASCGDEARYNEYARLVISEAKSKLSDLSPDVEEYWMLSIIIPNMYRRTGDFDKAEEYLNNIGVPALDDQKSNAFFLLAKRLLAEAISSKNMDRVPVKAVGDK